jgi:putative selenate reductase
MRTSVAGVYAVGDARRGPATVVEGIADAAAAAAAIADIRFDGYAAENRAAGEEKYRFKKGMVAEDVSAVPDWRCLGCPSICAVCADVCPNRANAVIHVPGRRRARIVHVDGMCNECGNCAVFCPYSGRPYKDKFTLFWSEEDFRDSENNGFLPLEGSKVCVRLFGNAAEYDIADPACTLPTGVLAFIKAVKDNYGYLL